MSAVEQDSLRQFLDSLKLYNVSKLIHHLHVSMAITEEEAKAMVRAKRAGTLANLKVLLTLPDRRESIIIETKNFVSSVFETTMGPITRLVSSSNYPSTLNLSSPTISAMYLGPQLLPAPHTQPGLNSDESSGGSTYSVASGMEVDHPEVNMSQECLQEDNIEDYDSLVPYNPNATADSGVATQDPTTDSQQSQSVNLPQSLVVNHNTITIQIQNLSTTPQNHGQVQERQSPGTYRERQGQYERSRTTRQDEIFRDCKPDFLKLVNIQTLGPLLLSEGWLTPHESQELELPWYTEAQKKATLFRIIPTKSPNYIEQFVRILRREDQHIGHKSLADILDNHYWTKKSATPL